MGRSPGARSGRAVGLLVLALYAAAAGAQPSGSSDPTVEAVWKSQRLQFEYRGYSTIYTCSGLQHKLKRILTRVGASGELGLQAYYCDDHAGIARFQIAMQSPVEATPANVRELTTYDTQHELIARARGERLASAQDIERFPAVWKTVSFASDRGMRLAPGDCELVRELRRQILPKMSVQIVRDEVRCSSAFGNISAPQLTVSALVRAQ